MLLLQPGMEKNHWKKKKELVRTIWNWSKDFGIFIMERDWIVKCYMPPKSSKVLYEIQAFTRRVSLSPQLILQNLFRYVRRRTLIFGLRRSREALSKMPASLRWISSG